MLTSRQAFKAAFVARCIESGMNVQEMTTLAKSAADSLETIKKAFDPLQSAWNLAGSIGKPLMEYGVPAAIAAPWVVGAGGGYALAKARDISDVDINEIKDQEVIDAYHRETERMKQEREARDFEAAHVRPLRGRSLM